MIFRLRVYRCCFRAIDAVYFPPLKAGNVLRGAIGSTGAAPESIRPSGLADAPRPFSLRVAHLDGQRFSPGGTFSLQVNAFDLQPRLREALEKTFGEWARTGLGPRRGRVELLSCSSEDVAVDLSVDLSADREVSKCSLHFRTPTDLKGNPRRDEIPFGVLFARIRDRISTLRGLYGEGPPEVDFRALGERADLVRTVRCDLKYHNVRRRSSRTGAVHGIGGVTGRVDYAGDLAEFLPWLRAAWWTGVGRHTVWGNGAVQVVHAE